MGWVVYQKGIRLLVSIFVSTIVLSCGGGGGESTVLPPPEDWSIGTYTVGYSAVYEASTTITTSDGQITLTGDIIYSITGTQTNPYGIECLVVESQGTLTSSDGSISVPIRNKVLIYQDPDKNIYDCGEWDSERGYIYIQDTTETPKGLSLAVNATEYPYPKGYSVSRRVFFDDGSWEDCVMTVLEDRAVITVPYGTFYAIKTQTSCSYSDNSTTSIVGYINYRIAPYLRSEGSGLTPDGTFDLTLELKDVL